ncbi:MAG TPA: segregation/condensation protein A, partial [Bacteroidota bacterium]|nr:segregation/condensation protein A [Bacteroidota bacterium]
MTYRVKLNEFEGPLDLLLFFIKRDELDIYDIPISKITKEFLEYLHYMQELDLEVAGDFIVMAAELMQIKVR